MTLAAATVVAGTPGLLDMAATRAITTSDLAIAQRLAQRALAGPVPETELLALQQPGLVGRTALRWADMEAIPSPLSRSDLRHVRDPQSRRPFRRTSSLSINVPSDESRRYD